MEKHITGPSTLRQYNEVRVVAILNKRNVRAQSADQRRPPRVGDHATILEVHYDPLSFELECSDSRGVTQWEGTYLFTDLLIERVS